MLIITAENSINRWSCQVISYSYHCALRIDPWTDSLKRSELSKKRLQLDAVPVYGVLRILDLRRDDCPVENERFLVPIVPTVILQDAVCPSR